MGSFRITLKDGLNDALNSGHFPTLQPYFDKLDHFVVNLANFLGLAFTGSEPVFVPMVDTT